MHASRILFPLQAATIPAGEQISPITHRPTNGLLLITYRSGQSAQCRMPMRGVTSISAPFCARETARASVSRPGPDAKSPDECACDPGDRRSVDIRRRQTDFETVPMEVIMAPSPDGTRSPKEVFCVGDILEYASSGTDLQSAPLGSYRLPLRCQTKTTVTLRRSRSTNNKTIR